MGKRSPEVDAYIARSAPFAQPILEKIREAFHAASPDITEVMKWSFPHFEYKGLLGSMASFKNHVSWGFWKAKLMSDPKGILDAVGETSMGGSKAKSDKDLPPKKVLVEYVREAIRLNEEGIKVARPASKGAAGPVEVPEDLAAELGRNKPAKAMFESFSPSQRREYVDWLNDAKQENTRKKRLATTLEWLAEGKPRHWKYMKER